MQVDMVDPGEQILREIADKRVTRDDVALTYAFCVRQAADVNYKQVNQAIIDRWSLAALKYIKEKAWRQI
ncbi:MAG: hypothetical protein ACREXY_13120 [Gammaproteobacteria bacterium]